MSSSSARYIEGEDVLSSDDEENSSFDEEDEEEKQFYNEIHAEYDDLTSGYTTISSNKGEYIIKKPINSFNITTFSSINQLSLL
jgi:hypothetical protein